MTQTKVHEGGCRCGAIRYRAVAEPVASLLCHCRSCRLSAGAHALAWAIFDEGAVEFTKGALRVHESSPGVERGFCGTCGTSLSYHRISRAGSFDVTIASLDDPEALPPTLEIWTKERVSWAAPLEHLAQFDESRTPAGELTGDVACE